MIVYMLWWTLIGIERTVSFNTDSFVELCLYPIVHLLATVNISWQIPCMFEFAKVSRSLSSFKLSFEQNLIFKHTFKR